MQVNVLKHLLMSTKQNLQSFNKILMQNQQRFSKRQIKFQNFKHQLKEMKVS